MIPLEILRYSDLNFLYVFSPPPLSNHPKEGRGIIAEQRILFYPPYFFAT
jgi:hypothetical protein